VVQYSLKFSLKIDIKRITIKIKIKIRIKIAIKVFITYKSYWLSDCYISIYVLFGCSTVGVIAVMWGNYRLGSVLRIWVLLVFDLPTIVWGLYSLFFVSLLGCLYVELDIQILMFCIYTVPRGGVVIIVL
jgi:hypothetical protein